MTLMTLMTMMTMMTMITMMANMAIMTMRTMMTVISKNFSCRGEGEVSQERVWWIDNMKYWVEGVAVLILCLAGILGRSSSFFLLLFLGLVVNTGGCEYWVFGTG